MAEGPVVVLPAIEDNISSTSADQVYSFVKSDESIFVYHEKEKRPKFVRDYLIGEYLGEGSYSRVRECLHTKTLRRLAIKILAVKRLRRIPGGYTGMIQEVKILRKLKHENVVKLYDWFEIEDKMKSYIVLEYCVVVLQDLLDVAPLHKLPLNQCHDYFNQLLQGLQYIHSKGIVHKDIKPGNLLINNSGTVKISDFGVSDIIDPYDSYAKCSSSNGSPAFQPPEIADGKEILNAFKIDVWSCGVTLYNITTGSIPFEGETLFRLYENISKMEHIIPKTLEDEDNVLCQLINGMLIKEPEDRWTLNHVRNHPWVKRLPPPQKYIEMPKGENGDDYKSMTMVPYLVHLFDIRIQEDNREYMSILRNVHKNSLESVQRGCLPNPLSIITVQPRPLSVASDRPLSVVSQRPPSNPREEMIYIDKNRDESRPKPPGCCFRVLLCLCSENCDMDLPFSL